MTQIFIVDDHSIMRQALRALLEEEKDWAVCGEAATAEEALEEIGSAMPDLVLIDVSLPGMSGIELARALRARHPDLLLAMLTGHGEKSHVDQAIEAGASGYILKGRYEKISTAIREVIRGQQYVSIEIDGSNQGTR